MMVQERSETQCWPAVTFGLAQSMQRTLVPTVSYQDTHIEAYGRTIPCDELGGDLVDLVTSEGHPIMYLADVSGHGVLAGVLMGMLKTAVRYGLAFGQTLPVVLDGINRVLPFVKQEGAYATFAALRFVASGNMEYINAGHVPLLHYRHGENRVVRHSMEQFPLGLFPDAEYASGHLECAPGDLFALFTDGLVEAPDFSEEQYRWSQLEDMLGDLASYPLPKIHKQAIQTLGAFGEQTDDQTLMLVRVLG
jgi:serine phosphatase RsbU (regulator of sigma subunit)